jgi:hypothetical protein
LLENEDRYFLLPISNKLFRDFVGYIADYRKGQGQGQEKIKAGQGVIFGPVSFLLVHFTGLMAGEVLAHLPRPVYRLRAKLSK